MALSSEYLTLLRTGINSSPEWKEAWDRVNAYLDALRAPEGIDRELILLSSFERAIARKRESPFSPATELVFEEAQKSLDTALGHLVDESVPEHRRSVEERVRLFLTDSAMDGVFRPEGPASKDFVEALKEVKLETAPRHQVASITPRPFTTTKIGTQIARVANALSPLGANRFVVWAVFLLLLALLVYFAVF
jgi:hypothetical protein